MPQARVLRNDALILDAAVEAASDAGWAGMTLAGVGQRAGLTIRPVRVRYRKRSTLATATWEERAGPQLIQALSSALSAAGLLDEPASDAAFASAMESIARPSASLRAAAELIVVSMFMPDLRGAVDQSLGAMVRNWLDPQQAGSAARAAQRGWVIMLGLGLLGVAHRPAIVDLDFQPSWQRILQALAVNRAPTPMPEVPKPVFMTHVPFDTGDPTTDAVLRATIDAMGNHGYEGAHLADIAQAARISEAAIFLRYPSKEALFVDAINRYQDLYIRAAHDDYYGGLEASHGAGIADAVVMRDMFHPDHQHVNIITMERARMTWHRPALAEAEEDRMESLRQAIADATTNPDYLDPARFHIARAVGLGFYFFPLVDDQAWDLPYSVITIPMNES